MKAKVYLCGPMEGQSAKATDSWRDEAKALLEECGFEILDPRGEDYRAPDFAQSRRTPDDLPRGKVDELVHSNMHMIRDADYMLVHHPYPSTGTDMEICYAGMLAKLVDANTVVVTVFPPGAQHHPWVRYFTHYICGDVKHACEWIKNDYEVRNAF